MNKHLLTIIALLLLSFTVHAQHETSFKAYPLGNANIDAAEQVVKMLVAPEGSVFVDKGHNRLLVIATTNAHSKVQDAIKQLDVPPVNVRIQVEFAGQSGGTSSAIGATVDGEVIIRDASVASRLEIDPHLSHQTTERTSNTRQLLLVQSGHEATLNIGTEVAYPEWFVDYGLRWGIISQEIKWRKVGASLIVKPTVMGNGMINVELIPELSGLVDGNPYKVRFARAATEVTVQNGTTIQLGGLIKDDNFYSHFLIGMDRSRSSQNLDIFLTPSIMKPGDGLQQMP